MQYVVGRAALKLGKVYCIILSPEHQFPLLVGGRAHSGGAKGGHTEDATMLHFAACVSITVTAGDL